MNRFHIVTGGPGSGKSTVIAALAAQGFAVMPESGRDVIRTQIACGGTALPWSDRAAFAEMMFAQDTANHEAAARNDGAVFFDRGIPDVIGYLTLYGLKVPATLAAAGASFRYSPTVFIAPPWREIFLNDAERKQDFAEAEATYAKMWETYTALGYDLVVLPRAPVIERAAFIQAALAAG